MTRSHVLALFSVFSLGCGMQLGIGPAKVGMDTEPGRPMNLAHEPCAVEGPGALKRDHTRDGKDDSLRAATCCIRGLDDDTGAGVNLLELCRTIL